MYMQIRKKIWKEKLNAVFDKMYAKADKLGGLVSGEHGIGYAKKTFLRKSIGDSSMELLN